MASPLRKTRKDGRPYTRPPEVEAAINGALSLDDATVVQRALITDPKRADRLPDEALVQSSVAAVTGVEVS